jgi:hypothetical protein
VKAQARGRCTGVLWHYRCAEHNMRRVIPKSAHTHRVTLTLAARRAQSLKRYPSVIGGPEPVIEPHKSNTMRSRQALTVIAGCLLSGNGQCNECVGEDGEPIANALHRH